MLGAMCHNAIDVVAMEMNIEGSISGRCQLLGSLSTHPDEVIYGIIRMLLGALGNVSVDSEVVSTANCDQAVSYNNVDVLYDGLSLF